LLYKLNFYGIHPNILTWLGCYLSNRKQRVLLNGAESSWCSVTSGVPQGSILGLLLFILYINDMPSNVPGNSLLFADDTKLFKKISNTNDCFNMQVAIDRLVTWSTLWRLDLNPSKCVVLTLSLKRKPILFDYRIGDAPLRRVSHQRDLGIIIDSKLTFTFHVQLIVGKANRLFGLIKRNFYLVNNVKALKLLYITLVRPILEYNTVIFNSISVMHSNRIECVQKRFLRYLHYKQGFHREAGFWCNCDYSVLCKFYGIQSLVSRRQTLDLVFLRRCLLSLYDCIECTSFFSLKVSRPNARLKPLIYVPTNRVDVTKRGFIGRTARLFNSMQNCKIDIFNDSLYSFKKSISIAFKDL
jgi:hypothetical protein